MQSKIVVALPFIAFLLLASHSISADKDALQGTWVVNSLEIAGKNIDKNKGRIYTFAGDRATTNIKGEEESATYRTHDSESPKQIVISNERGTIVRAIYKIENDTLTLCVGEGGRAPKTFESKHHFKMVLKRRKR